MSEKQNETRTKRYRPSLFWPAALITVGIVFLMENLGMLSGDAWSTLWRLWPLLLILIGLDGFWRRQGWVGASLMIAVGIVFLLNNFGYLALNVWQAIFNLWPILLVAIGFDILVGHRSKLAALIGLVVILGLLAGALWVMGTDVRGGQVLDSHNIRQDIDGATQAIVRLEPGAGVLRISHMLEPIALVMGSVPADNAVRVSQDFTLDGDTALYSLRASGGIYTFPQNPDVYLWDLELNSDIPTELEINLGAGQADLNLDRLDLRNLEFGMGAGQAEIGLPASASLEARIDLAVGQLIINVPPEIGLRVQEDTALVTVHYPPGYSLSGGFYTSPGYDNADFRIDLYVDMAVGQLIIREE